MQELVNVTTALFCAAYFAVQAIVLIRIRKGQ